MLTQIKGLHHVTSMAADAQQNSDFFTKTLGLRRVKKTVNFDAPDVYHLYYGDETGSAGTVMTYFPFPDIGRGRPGTGEVGTTVFSVPQGSLGFWQERLAQQGVTGLKSEETFGEKRLNFAGPDGDGFALPQYCGRVPVRLRPLHGGASFRAEPGGGDAEAVAQRALWSDRRKPRARQDQHQHDQQLRAGTPVAELRRTQTGHAKPGAESCAGRIALRCRHAPGRQRASIAHGGLLIAIP